MTTPSSTSLRPGEIPPILRRPRKTPVTEARPSLTVTSSASAPARGTIRTDRTSPRPGPDAGARPGRSASCPAASQNAGAPRGRAPRPASSAFDEFSQRHVSLSRPVAGPRLSTPGPIPGAVALCSADAFPSRRSAVAAVTCALLVAAGVAACGGGDDDDAATATTDDAEPRRRPLRPKSRDRRCSARGDVAVASAGPETRSTTRRAGCVLDASAEVRRRRRARAAVERRGRRRATTRCSMRLSRRTRPVPDRAALTDEGITPVTATPTITRHAGALRRARRRRRRTRAPRSDVQPRRRAATPMPGRSRSTARTSSRSLQDRTGRGRSPPTASP